MYRSNALNRLAALAVLALALCAATGGYGCKEKGERRQVVLKLEKMTCHGCVKAITLALKGVKGVLSASVTLRPPRAVVVYDSSKTDVKALIRATTEIGYPASVLRGSGGS